MPVLGERLGELHADPVHLEVVAVGRRRRTTRSRSRRSRAAHRHQLQRQHIGAVHLDRPLAGGDEVGDVEEPRTLLARELEAHAHRSRRSGSVSTHRVAVTTAGKQPYTTAAWAVIPGGEPVDPVPQPRPAPRSPRGPVARPSPPKAPAQPPLTQEERTPRPGTSGSRRRGCRAQRDCPRTAAPGSVVSSDIRTRRHFHRHLAALRLAAIALDRA